MPDIISTDLKGNSEADIEKEVLACEQGSIVMAQYIPTTTILISSKNKCPALNASLRLPR